MSRLNMEIHGEHTAGGEYHLNCGYCRGEVKTIMRLSKTSETSVVLVASENPAVQNIRILDAMLDKLDTTQHLIQSHTCEQAWRPTTAEEIQPGWEVRSRRGSGSEAIWGTVHHQDIDGDWRTESDILLTYEAAGWTYETTAPLSAPDPRIAVVMKWYGSTAADHAGIASLLARLDNLKVVEYSEPHSN